MDDGVRLGRHFVDEPPEGFEPVISWFPWMASEVKPSDLLRIYSRCGIVVKPVPLIRFRLVDIESRARMRKAMPGYRRRRGRSKR